MTVDLARIVTPLVFNPDATAYSAITAFGEYRVARVHGEWMWFFAFNPKSNEDRIDRGYGDRNTKKSAQAAANADHAARVLAALDAELLGKLVEALKYCGRDDCTHPENRKAAARAILAKLAVTP